MGYQLRIPPNNGRGRKGTTFKELQTLFIDQITTKFIFESLDSYNINDNGFDVKRKLEINNFDIVGVTDDDKNVIGYAKKEELQNNIIANSLRSFELNLIIIDSTPISKLFSLLAAEGFVFVKHADKIVGIVTKADINKIVVRIYLFGIISLFEMHLNYWINKCHSENSWKNLITEKRFIAAKKIFESNKDINQDLSLRECLQFCDKREILKHTPEFILNFNLSKSEFDKILRTVEKIRNKLAHSQNSIIENVKWNDFIKTISLIEKFLIESEQITEDKTHSEFGKQ